MPHYDSLKYLVKRDGVSQKQRRPAALDPSFVKLDERKLEDFLVFATEYSKKIKFFNLKNIPEGNWEGFWNSDPTIVIAAITKTNPLPSKRAIDRIFSLPPTIEGLENSIGQILDIAKKIDYWFKNIKRGASLHVEIRRLIMANFEGFLPGLATLEKTAETFIEDYPIFDQDKYFGFSPEWGFDPEATELSANLNLLRPKAVIDEENPFKCDQSITDKQKLEAAYQLLKELFTNVYNVYFQIIQLSSTHFQQSLTRKDHPPHIALFISFLRLFINVQEDLNQMTKRHLDFYYRGVLGLKPKDIIPDKVHLFFELAKNRLEHSLEGGIRFRAGKDALGNDLFYALDKPSVFNVATVESLRSLCLEKSPDDEERTIGLKAAPVANSEDGLGTPIKDEEKPTWFTMGSTKMPNATLGFALASNELLLTEGIRTIAVHVHTNNPIAVIKNTFNIYLSGEGEWINANSLDTLNVKPFANDTGENGFSIELQLDVDTPAILPFDKDGLEEELGTDLPVMKVLFSTEKSANKEIFKDLLNLVVEKITLEVNVTGLTQIMAFSDEGKLDTGSPFLPFTAIPKKGSSFYFGNAEIFQKNLKSVHFKINWEDPPEDFAEYYAGYENIGDGFKANVYSIGEKASTPIRLDVDGSTVDQIAILENDEETFTSTQAGDSQIAKLISGEKAENYGKGNKIGFLRMNLEDDFGHSQYQQVLTRQMLAVARFPNVVPGAWYRNTTGDLVKAGSTTTVSSFEVVIPNPPYTPSIKSISMDYTSETLTGENNGGEDIQLLHLHPFPNTYKHLKGIQGSFLVPQFKNPKSKTEIDVLVPEAGALLIGINNLQPKQSLSLLFQLVENTADAELAKPKVRWYYLKSNQWEPFRESQVVSDTTDELLTSGIVELSIPDDINKENTVLSSGLHWLKAAVSENPEAISQAINIHAQAARVTFQNNENDLAHLNQPLPAATISKLENDDSAIKGIFQLYDSFGGRPAESDLGFYNRISEHLRHKGRAITLFDYERLILEAFPEVYKVRCVNHLDDTFHLNPGHVIVSVVPDFSKLKAVDRRQPKVSLAQLERIRRFLEDRNCAFVGNQTTNYNDKPHSLHVLNPDYEKIRLDFRVRFLPEITAIEFHIEKLKTALVRFLSPWAFEDSADITFGGRVFKSVILHFVEKQPYVDYVKDFKMMHDNAIEDVNVIEAKTPISILVPAAEEKMSIIHIEDEECKMDKHLAKSGLGYQNLEDIEVNH
ncbi:hypothetical protein [Negadavirga shengliensis]|uniref:Baseplate J-like protein n=1 Tax=Negadavirga shengliensis TaxID=1389218 RepID=A0ABV9T5X6_9BACT